MPDTQPAPDAAGCASYNGGHHVHWIQAKLSMADRDHMINVMSILIDGHTVTIDLDDGTQRVCWMHDTERLAARLGASATVRGHGVLTVPGSTPGSGIGLFSMGSHDTHRCGAQKAPAQPVRWDRPTS